MNAIAVCCVDDRSAESTVVAMLACQSARARQGPTAIACASRPGVALGYRGRRHRAAAAPRNLPVTHEASGCLLTGDIRLDTRAALCDRLAISAGDDVDDAEIALLAYLRWGPTFARHLSGAFAIAIWDPRCERLLLCRDHLGVRPVLYHCTSRTLLAASDLDAVAAAMPHRPAVYEDKLLHALIEPLEAAEVATTVYRGVFRLPAAHVLTWSPGDSAPAIESYWRMDRPAELVLADDQQYADAFTEVFTEAVRCRSVRPGRPAAMLSAGLDSTAVVAFGDRGHEPSTTYSAIETTPGPTSDTPHIAALVDHLGLEHRQLDEHEIGASCDLQDLFDHPDSVMDTAMGVLWAITSRMQTDDQHVLLTGIAGDELLTTPPVRLARALARNGRARDAWVELAVEEGASKPLRSSIRTIAGQLLPRPVSERLRAERYRRRFERRLDQLEVTDARARRLRSAHDRMHAEFRRSGDHRVDRIISPFVTVGLERYDRVAARHGVEVRHPFVDLRVIEFCLSLPATQIQRQGWSKWVLRNALTGRVPPSVIWRPKSYQGMTPFSDAFFAPTKPATHSLAAPPPPFLLSYLTDSATDAWAGLWWSRHGS